MIDLQCATGALGILYAIASELIGLSKSKHNSVVQILTGLFRRK